MGNEGSFFVLGLVIGVLFGGLMVKECGYFNYNELLERNVIEYNQKTGSLDFVEKKMKIKSNEELISLEVASFCGVRVVKSGVCCWQYENGENVPSNRRSNNLDNWEYWNDSSNFCTYNLETFPLLNSGMIRINSGAKELLPRGVTYMMMVSSCTKRINQFVILGSQHLKNWSGYYPMARLKLLAVIFII